MPELPEVECIRRALLPLIGRCVESVDLRRRDIVENPPARRAAGALLAGDVIRGFHRHGKQLAMEGGSGRVVCVQLGMSGQLLVREGAAPKPPSHVHAVWVLGDGLSLAFRDPRRFGGLSLYGSMQEIRAERWAALGPDALDHRAEDLAAACRGSGRKIKDLLLGQGAIAGVGNIYADESLFLARVRPTRRAGRLTRAEVDGLSEAVRRVLARAVEAGGTTLRDYVRPDGGLGGAGALHLAYGRGGEPCVRCSTPLRRTTVGQRTTCYCPSCQV